MRPIFLAFSSSSTEIKQKSFLDSFYYNTAHLSKAKNLNNTKASIFTGILNIQAL